MSFNNIIGHKIQIDYLKNIIQNNKLSHAFIFEGLDGIGKSLIGINLAKSIFCDSHSGDACGVCRSCIKMDHDNHPDYMMIEPDGKNIKNAQVEAFQEFAVTKPYDGDYKIVLIKEAEKMNASSQNRILKTLEEPPEHVIIIMITNNSESLLPTVVSRCQVIKFNGLKNQEIAEYLFEKFEIKRDQAELISRLSVGSLEKAHDYIESDSFKLIKKSVLELLNALNSNQRAKLLELSLFFIANKENIVKLLDYMILWYRDILLYKKTKIKDILIHIDELELIKKLSRNLSVKKLIDNIEVIEATKKKLNQHANYELTIEVMLIKLLEV